MTNREKAHHLIDALPEQDLAEIVDLMEQRRGRALPRLLAEAPDDDEPVTPELAAELDRARQEGGSMSADEIKAKYGL